MSLKRSDAFLPTILLIQLTSLRLFSSLANAAPEPYAEAPSSASAYASAEGQSPERELEKTLEQLKDQIAEQQQLLNTAQTDRERQRIQNLIGFLQDQQHTLEDLFEQIAGTDYANFEVGANAEEEQSVHRTEEYENTLDKARP